MIFKKALTVAAGLTILGMGVLTAPIFATSGPEFTAKLEVKDQTTGTDFVDANDWDSALHANTGDALVYRATLHNNSSPDPKGKNNVFFLFTYPMGSDKADDSVQLEVSLAPGKSLTKEFHTTVTANPSDDGLDAMAGFFCDATACPYFYENDVDYSATIDMAYVVVDAPKDPPTTEPDPTDTPSDDPTDTPAGDPTDTPKDQQNPPVVTTDTQTPQTPAKLPNTGSPAGITMAVALLAVAGGYALNTLRLRRNVR